jgi:hypothetical protein
LGIVSVSHQPLKGVVEPSKGILRQHHRYRQLAYRQGGVQLGLRPAASCVVVRDDGYDGCGQPNLGEQSADEVVSRADVADVAEHAKSILLELRDEHVH